MKVELNSANNSEAVSATVGSTLLFLYFEIKCLRAEPNEKTQSPKNSCNTLTMLIRSDFKPSLYIQASHSNLLRHGIRKPFILDICSIILVIGDVHTGIASSP